MTQGSTTMGNGESKHEDINKRGRRVEVRRWVRGWGGLERALEKTPTPASQQAHTFLSIFLLFFFLVDLEKMRENKLYREIYTNVIRIRYEGR